MTLILGLDVATGTGWAVYDTERRDATVCGVIDLRLEDSKKMTGMERRKIMRRNLDEALCELINKWRPDVACIEQPLNFIGANEPTEKPMPLFKRAEAPLKGKPKRQGGGPNADTAFMLNQLFTVADVVCRHKTREVIEVAPTTWQTLTKAFSGDTKERSIAFCRMHRIEIPGGLTKPQRGDAADAAVIAYWAAGKAQQLKMQERVGAAA
jgi:hypothetical protein